MRDSTGRLVAKSEEKLEAPFQCENGPKLEEFWLNDGRGRLSEAEVLLWNRVRKSKKEFLGKNFLFV